MKTVSQPNPRHTRVLVKITVGPQACADCLVPKDLMRSILGDTLGVPTDAIDLTYPTEER